MIRVDVDASQLAEYGRVLAASGPGMRKDLEVDVMETSAHAQGIAREAAPIFRGTLVNSIQVQPILMTESDAGFRIEGGIATSQPHGVVMEEGRRPNRQRPPLDAIVRWVELKVRRGDLSLSSRSEDDMTDQIRGDAAPSYRRRKKQSRASKIRGLAFVIARSIGRKGTKPRRFMAKAETAAQPHLEGRVAATVNRWIERLGG